MLFCTIYPLTFMLSRQNQVQPGTRLACLFVPLQFFFWRAVTGKTSQNFISEAELKTVASQLEGDYEIKAFYFKKIV